MVNCILLNTAPVDVYAHMAFDDFYVNGAQKDKCFLRFFNWSQNLAATFGYAQFESSVKKQLAAQNITRYTRRPTGGGIVVHNGDLTFSLIFNADNTENPRVIYSALHSLIKEELLKLKAQVALYNKESDYRPAGESGIASNCFSNPVSDDLLGADGAKILGGAIRRYGARVLYQGSLQTANARGNTAYIAAIKTAVLKYLGASSFVIHTPEQAECEQVEKLAREQYQTAAWIEKF